MALHGKYSNYRYCINRDCKNTSIKTPEKLWIRVPIDKDLRNTWLKLANRDPEFFSPSSRLYLCEDHFDLKNDMENYTQYQIMGSVKQIKLKPNCVPTRFSCQIGRKHKLTQELSTATLHEELINERTATTSFTSSCKKYHDKAVQVIQHNTNFSQAIQVQSLTADMARKCCVPGCKSNYSKTLETEPSVSAFSFPKNGELRRKWLRAIPRANWTPSKHTVVCVKHFCDSDVIRLRKMVTPEGVIFDAPLDRIKLVDGAVPSIFPNVPLCLGKHNPPSRKIARVCMERTVNHQAVNDCLGTESSINLPSTSTAITENHNDETDDDNSNDVSSDDASHLQVHNNEKTIKNEYIEAVYISDRDNTKDIKEIVETESEINTEVNIQIKQEVCDDELSDTNMEIDDINPIHIKSEIDLGEETVSAADSLVETINTQLMDINAPIKVEVSFDIDITHLNTPIENDTITTNQISTNQQLIHNINSIKMENDSNEVKNHGNDATNCNDAKKFLNSLLPVLMMLNEAQVKKFKNKVVDIIEEILKESPDDE